MEQKDDDKKQDSLEIYERKHSIEEIEQMFSMWMGGHSLPYISEKYGIGLSNLKKICSSKNWVQRRKEISLEVQKENNSLIIASKKKLLNIMKMQIDLVERKLARLTDSDSDGTIVDDNGVRILTEPFIKSPKDAAIVMEMYRVIKDDLRIDELDQNLDEAPKTVTEKQKKAILDILNNEVEAEFVEVNTEDEKSEK